VFVSGRYWRYSEVSEQLHEILTSFTPLVEPIALDEAFLDVAGATRLLGSPLEIARDIRQTVRRRLGLDCSVGVARTKLIAKLASEAAKPVASLAGTKPGRGVVAVAPGDELAFLHPLPVRALWGVGPATGARLAGLGVTTVAELAAIPEETLRRSLGDAHGRHLAALARGEDARGVQPVREAKSISHEETFATDLHDHDTLRPHAIRMADAVANRLREAGLRARTVTVKVRYPDRATITRAQSIGAPTAAGHTLATLAVALLESVEVGQGVRLLGVAASGLSAGAEGRQLAFDDMGGDAAAADTEQPGAGGAGGAPGPAWEEVEAAVAAVRARYGEAAVAPAALVGRHGLSVKRRGDTQWGPSAAGADGPSDAEPRA
jgi:DNA polymerase-4